MPKVATRVDVDTLLLGLAMPRDTDDVDGRILDAATTLLLRHGLSGLEVDDVAGASGVGRSTIYRRFSDRNGLIVAALAQEGRRFLAALADAVAPLEDLEEQVVSAFAAGLRLARRGAFGELLRNEPQLLQILTVDSEPVVAAATEQLVSEATQRVSGLDVERARGTAELLIRLAISFVLQPSTVLALDDDVIEQTVRRHVGPLVRID